MIDLGVQHDIVNKAGSWFSYGDDRIGQGKDNAREFLREHAEMADEIERKVRAILMPPPVVAVPDVPEEVADDEAKAS